MVRVQRLPGGKAGETSSYRALMCFGGSDVRKIAQNVGIIQATYLTTRTGRQWRCWTITMPLVCHTFERFKFRQLQFNPHETLDQFTLRLQSQASLCSFGDQIEEMMMDQIVFATKEDDKLKAKYLGADTSLDEMLKIGRTYESVKLQVREFRGMLAQPVSVEEVNVVERQKYQKLCGRCAVIMVRKNGAQRAIRSVICADYQVVGQESLRNIPIGNLRSRRMVHWIPAENLSLFVR